MYSVDIPGKPRRVLILGSGALQIGQAGEFDYSGSQAIKALKQEGVQTVLINPNIATVQTSAGFADRIYLVAVTPEAVEEILVKEDVDAIMLSFGGQTALNCGIALDDRGVLDRHGVQVLGTPIETIRKTEDRKLFANLLRQIDVKVANGQACQSIEEARTAARSIGYPVMLRGAFALGGKGSGIVESEKYLDEALRRAFSDGVQQVLVEESLRGWKEIEYEMVRDGRDNCIAVCNMENLDPVGIHTGESIVVAPSQTLNDQEYQDLRSIAIKVVRALGIVGECNIQFALNPHNFDYRVIEVNARLSRSSALASKAKATGYPLAFVAALIALGKTLTQIPNGITRRTTAFFEPAMDYSVCKCPRWDLAKFRGATKQLGSEMKSVGEVMAIGRTFPEVIQKALRMLDIGVRGLDPDAFEFDDIHTELGAATPRRIFALAKAIRDGIPIEDIHDQTQVDCWFIRQIKPIVKMQKHLHENPRQLDVETLRDAKKLGFSDMMIEDLQDRGRGSVGELRRELKILPSIAQIDTMAAEFPSDTNYLYTTYHATKSEAPPTHRKKIMVLGSGVYRIGQAWSLTGVVSTRFGQPRNWATRQSW